MSPLYPLATLVIILYAAFTVVYILWQRERNYAHTFGRAIDYLSCWEESKIPKGAKLY